MGKKQITTRQEMLKLLKNNEMKTSNVKEKKKQGQNRLDSEYWYKREKYPYMTK